MINRDMILILSGRTLVLIFLSEYRRFRFDKVIFGNFYYQ